MAVLSKKRPHSFSTDIMKVMLFAAGLGTRLKPLTDYMPKALVPVGGRPLLAITLDRLKQAGATEVAINVHHFSEQIIEYLQTHDFGIKIHISDETGQLLETGGGLRQAAPLFSENPQLPILIHNVDILSNADLQDFYISHPTDAAALLVSQRETKRYLLFDSEDKLVGWINTENGSIRTPYKKLDVNSCRRYAFSGIHTFSPTLIPYMNDFPSKFSIIDFYLSICDKVCIKAHSVLNLKLLDVGKQDTLKTAEVFLKSL